MSCVCSSAEVTDLLRRLQEQIQCPICLEKFVDPRSLPCQHVFCRSCLDQVYNEEKDEVKCPTCRAVTSMSRKGSSSLPKAIHTNSLVDLYNSEPLLQQVASEEDDSCEDPEKEEVEKCSVHGRVLEMYCSTCQEVVCVVCAVQSHNNRHECDLLSEIFTHHWATIKEYHAIVKKQMKLAKDALDAINRQRKNIIEQGESLKGAIDAFIDGLVERMLAAGSVVKQDVVNTVGYMANKLNIQSSGIEDMLTQLVTIDDTIDGLSALSQQEILRKKGELQESIRNACEPVNVEQLTLCQRASIKFAPNTGISEMLDKLSIGKIILKDSNSDDADLLADDKHSSSPSTDDEAIFEQSLEYVPETEPAPVKSSQWRHSVSEEAPVKKNSVSLVKAEVLPVRTSSDVAKCSGTRSEIAVVDKSQSFNIALLSTQSIAESSLSCKLVHATTGSIVHCTVREKRKSMFGNRQPSFNISYMPVHPGEHTINVYTSTAHLPCHPSQLYVLPSTKQSHQQVRSIKGLLNPWGLAIHNNMLLVSEHTGHSIKVLEKSGSIVNTLGLVGGVDKCKFHSPKGLAITYSDLLLVIDNGTYCIQQATMDGQRKKCILNNTSALPLHFNRPSDMAVDSLGHVYISDTLNHRVQALNPDLSFSHIISKYGHEPGKLNSPTGIAVDAHNIIYVCDTGNSRVQKFASGGKYIGHFGHKILCSPQYIAIDSKGVIYITDNEGEVGKVVLFDSDGEHLCSYWNEKEGPGHLINPQGIAVDSYRNIYVCNYDKNEITIIGAFH